MQHSTSRTSQAPTWGSEQGRNILDLLLSPTKYFRKWVHFQNKADPEARMEALFCRKIALGKLRSNSSVLYFVRTNLPESSTFA